jgi:retron-type reverse transcriptase
MRFLTARVTGGCPQGGVLSPLLWNLVVDELLADLNDQGLCAMSYADDIVIIVQGKFTHTIRELMQAALNEVVKWTTVLKRG